MQRVEFARRGWLYQLARQVKTMPDLLTKDDGKQKFFWWRLGEPWWTLAVAFTLAACWAMMNWMIQELGWYYLMHRDPPLD